MTHFVRGLPVKEASGKVDTAAAGTVAKDGMLIATTEEVAVAAPPYTTCANGYCFDANGKLVVEDIGAGAIGAGAAYRNGLPFRASTGALIVSSTAAVAYTHSGIPFAASGAVATA